MPLASITFNFLNGWIEPPPVVAAALPFCPTISDDNRDGTVRDRNRTMTVGNGNRRAAVTPPRC